MGSSKLYDDALAKAEEYIVDRARRCKERGSEWPESDRPQMDVLMHTVCNMLWELGCTREDVEPVARAFGAADVECHHAGWLIGYADGKKTGKLLGQMFPTDKAGVS